MLSRKLALLTATLLISTAPLEGVARSKAHSQKQAAGGDTVPVLNGTVHAAGDAAGTVHDFNALLDQVAGSGRVAGLAVAVVKDKEVLLQRGIGYADMSSGAPVTPDTVFRLASLSKAFASALAGLLINEGVFKWDTRVAEVVPAFELNDSSASGKLSVRDILSQRVGLPHNTYDRMLEADEPYPVLLDKLREVPLTCGVGECYGYQNITYSLIGEVVFALTGDFFPHQVEKRLFHPLGMTTATYGRAGLESSANWARPHAHARGGWVPFEIDDAYYHVAPAAGVNASIKDMTQWLIAQMGGRPEVLSPELLETLHAPQINTPIERRSAPWRRVRVSETHYALGWRVFDYSGETLIFHAGAVRGYRSMIAFLPKQKFGAVMLWNCESAVPIGLLPMLLDRYLGLPEVDWAGIDAPEAPAKRARIAAGGR
jgi:beta-lactamase class C